MEEEPFKPTWRDWLQVWMLARQLAFAVLIRAPWEYIKWAALSFWSWLLRHRP